MGLPDIDVQKIIAANEKLVDSWEIILPRKDMKKGISLLRKFKKNSRLKLYLSKINTLDDQRVEKNFQFSHFPTHGFRPQDRHMIHDLIQKERAGKLLDGFVFLVTGDDRPYPEIYSLSKFITAEQTRALINLKMPRKGEGAAFEDERAVANIVAESIVAVHGLSDVNLFLDTLVHHDRGYYPRNGLLDRRYNPRLSYYVARHLNWCLPDSQKGFSLNPLKTGRNVRGFLVQSSGYTAALVLFRKKAQRVELLMLPDGANIYKTSWLSLYTGRTLKAVQVEAGKNKAVFTLPSKTEAPGLLIFS